MNRVLWALLDECMKMQLYLKHETNSDFLHEMIYLYMYVVSFLSLVVLVGGVLLIFVCLFKNRNRILSRCTNSDFRYKTVGFNTSRAEDCEVDIDLYRGSKQKLPGPQDADNDEI